MPTTLLKSEQIVSAALGILEREATLGALVSRNGFGNFVGAKNDTISIRLPAFAPARSRGLRSGDARVRDELHERKVDVTLDTDVYKDIQISDAILSLDIINFGEQVLNPVMAGIAAKIEDLLAVVIEGATYENVINYTYGTSDPFGTLVTARQRLNLANVPSAGRRLILGANLEAEFLQDAKFNDVARQNDAGFREGQIGRVAGFDVFPSNSIDPDHGYAFHQTAYALVQRAPVVPQGAPWGSSREYAGYALRAVQLLDSTAIEDVLAMDAWMGASVVPDEGYIDANGIWVPANVELGSPVTLATSAAADDIIDTAAAHGFVAGDEVSFTALTGGTGLSTDRRYYVIAANLAATTFQVSTTPGGSAALFSTDITAGTVRKGGSSLVMRAVKIIGAP